MNGELFREVAYWIDSGASPGCALVLGSPDSKDSPFAYGHYAGPGSQPVTTDTMYDLASVSKLFTTALILQLHEQGHLSINDRCSLYLPNFYHSSLRIIDLLTHHVDFGFSLSAYSKQFTSAEDFRKALLQARPPEAPSEAVTYANLQFFYLGIIIETVTGQSLQEVVRGLCKELSLEHTFTGEDIARLHMATPPTEIIDGHIIEGMTHDESTRLLGGLTGYAGMFATAPDLAMFGRAWLDGHILSQETLEELAWKEYDPSGTMPQALGWRLRLTGPDGTYPTPGIYSHTGYTGSLLAVCSETGRVCAFTCNRTYYGRDNTKQRYIWQLLIDWVQARPVVALPV